MEMDHFDAIVIGAGAAGLIAAWELAATGKKTAVVEARDRIGGRIHTVYDPRFDLPVELGAEFIHGNLAQTQRLLDRAGMDYYAVEGSIWQREDGKLQEQEDFIEDYSFLEKQFKKLKTDIPVSRFLAEYLEGEKHEELRFTLKNYVEGYYAADTQKASTFSLRDELTGADDEQYRPEGGYGSLMDHLYQQCMRMGVRFFFSCPAREVRWQTGAVEVQSQGQVFRGSRLLVTVPVGVLQARTLAFVPDLPQKMEAAQKLGFGPVVKTILQFAQPFWKDRNLTEGKNLSKLSFIFSQAVIPTWWTYHPKHTGMITGWSGGPHALDLKDLKHEEVLAKGIQSLAEVFRVDESFLRGQLKGWQVCNWLRDPYTCGGYSYEVVDGPAAREVLLQPEADTIFFAGEGLFTGPEIGTVEAALVTGRNAAHQMVASFPHPHSQEFG